jgi:hypothetical protein
VHEVVKFKANVPRVVFNEEIENEAEPLALIDCVAGEILILTGEEVVSVPAVFELKTIVPLLPPFFLIEIDEGFTISLQPPEPLPVTGGPAAPEVVVSQSKVLLWAPVPVTTALEETPEVVLTVA